MNAATIYKKHSGIFDPVLLWPRRELWVLALLYKRKGSRNLDFHILEKNITFFSCGLPWKTFIRSIVQPT